MTYPRLTIDRQKLIHNTKRILELCDEHQITAHLVTRQFDAFLPMIEVIRSAGARHLADTSLLRLAQYDPDLPDRLMLRQPMRSEASQVVRTVDISLNSDWHTICALSDAAYAQGMRHGIILMVEQGDLREGVPVEQLEEMTGRILNLRGIRLAGIGTNHRHLNGVIPTADSLFEFSALVQSIRHRFNIRLPYVSGGNSAAIALMLDGKMPVGINHLRLGEAWLTGKETAHGRRIADLFNDIFMVQVEVTSNLRKAVLPTGPFADGHQPPEPESQPEAGASSLRLTAAGEWPDLPAAAFTPRLNGLEVCSIAGDQLVLTVSDAIREIATGEILEFSPSYAALGTLFASRGLEKVLI